MIIYYRGFENTPSCRRFDSAILRQLTTKTNIIMAHTKIPRTTAQKTFIVGILAFIAGLPLWFLINPVVGDGCMLAGFIIGGIGAAARIAEIGREADEWEKILK